MTGLTRRTVLTGAALLAARPVPAETSAAETSAAETSITETPPLPLGPATSFAPDEVTALARDLSTRAYEAPPRVPDVWSALSYDDYRRLRFDADRAPWRDDAAHVEFFPPGLYFTEPIEVSLVEDGMARPVLYDPQAFSIPDDLSALRGADPGGYSGFRIVDRDGAAGAPEEYLVFQGASYFRGRGFHDVYGLSARGLAVETAEPGGEEFPAFRRFWIERPSGAGAVRIHALLDGPSCTGAYTFTAMPGDALTMRVSARLFPRRPLAHVGIAAETSMFLFDETMRARFDDFRPAVHDSDGLLIDNGAGERLFRPLANPANLQVSQFLDDGPAGFGLMQRARALSDFEDYEALYHERPGLWVSPEQSWGRGAVTLVEIPTDKEIYDNIVAYWRPAAPLEPGVEHRFDYALTWGANPAPEKPVARVENTLMGERLTGPDLDADGRRVVIDFAPHPRLADLDALRPFVGVDRGAASAPVVTRRPETGGVRLAFHFEPGDHSSIELRAQVLDADGPASEVWLYRWTPPVRS